MKRGRYEKAREFFSLLIAFPDAIVPAIQSHGLASKQAALRSQEQAVNNAGSEYQHRVLVFEAQSREDANQIHSFWLPVFTIQINKKA